MDLWDKVRAERQDLADLLAGLTPDQWDAPTLCPDWSVRGVIGHMIGTIEATPVQLIVGTAKAGFSPDRYNAEDGRRRGAADPQKLLATFRALVGSRRHPPFLGAPAMLLDALVHNQDIRRPLGLPRVVPDDRLRPVAEKLKATGFPFGTRKRIAGVRLTATDMDWSTGDGPEVRGPAEALVMMMAGRKAALDDLSGEGAGTLASRF